MMSPGLLLIFLMFVACNKEVAEVTAPVPFSSTTYQSLGGYDFMGKPDNLMAPDVISSNMLSFIGNTLPDLKDLRVTHPDLLTTDAIADISIKLKSDVFITFVAQGTSAKNAFAFYTYPSDAPPVSAKDIKTIVYVFPNTGSSTPLRSGDKVKIGTFDKGVSVGFVLLSDAWNATTKKLNNTAVHFCSNDVLNPEADVNLRKEAGFRRLCSYGGILYSRRPGMSITTPAIAKI